MYRSVVIGISLLFLLFTALVYSALSLPKLDGHFEEINSDLLYSYEEQSWIVRNFETGSQSLSINPYLLYEEPDVLPTYGDMNTLFATHKALFKAGKEGNLAITSATDERIAITFHARAIHQLPSLFWLQALCALGASIICLLVWIPSQKTVAVIAFCLTGAGYVLAAASAAIYSTRDVFIDGHLFQALSGINCLGTMLFVTSLGIFLWHYPNAKPRKLILALYLCAFTLQQVAHTLQYFPSPAEGMYAWVMLLFLFGLVGSAIQWRQTAHKPAERVVLTWVLLSILSGTLFFTGGMIIPVLLRVAEPSDQALLLATFLFMYFGMMLAVLRYRLFDIQRWSFAIWSWILGGIAVLICDFLLISLLTLTGTTSLAISLALVGWLYFPVRQWLWRRLFSSEHKGLDNWLKQTLPTLLEHEPTSSDNAQLIKALNGVFRPVTHILYQETHETHLSSNAESLWIALPNNETLCLQHAEGGRRIFNRNDMETANLILALHALITDIAQAKQEGARAERNRIRRDLHDDLGAKLLRLLHQSSGDTQALVRESIRDLRNLINGQQFVIGNIEQCFSIWHKEATERCSLVDVSLYWQADIQAIEFTPLQHEHLGQILREAISNALRHESTAWIDVRARCEPQQCIVTIENNFKQSDARTDETGMGTENLRKRTELLNGQLEHSTDQDIWCLRITFPLN